MLLLGSRVRQGAPASIGICMFWCWLPLHSITPLPDNTPVPCPSLLPSSVCRTHKTPTHPPYSPFPSKKAITLLKGEPFTVSLAYDAADSRIPPHFSKALGTYTVELPKVRGMKGGQRGSERGRGRQRGREGCDKGREGGGGVSHACWALCVSLCVFVFVCVFEGWGIEGQRVPVITGEWGLTD